MSAELSDLRRRLHNLIRIGTIDAVNPGAATAPRWSAEHFIERLTMEEQLAILGSDDPMVRLFTAKLYAAGVVVADDPRTQQGMGYLVSKGLLTEERRQAILSRDA